MNNPASKTKSIHNRKSGAAETDAVISFGALKYCNATELILKPQAV